MNEAYPITLFGATGITGQLIAHALADAGLRFRIAGRSAEKLAALSKLLPGEPPYLVADATQPSSLAPLVQNTRLLINCAGPFTDLGERVIAMAAINGAHYLDTTNELGYVFRARGYDEMARRTGAALVPACGFEVAFADCAAQMAGAPLLKQGKRALDEVNVLYKINGQGASQGTRKSAIRSLATSWIAYRDGDWVGQIPGGQVRAFPLTGTEQYSFSFPSSESVTIPAHLAVQRVDAWMAMSANLRVWARVFIPLFARMSRSILRGLMLRMASLGGSTPEKADDQALRAEASFTIYTEAKLGRQTRVIILRGSDPYTQTANIITHAARQMTAPDYHRKGVLAPAQAFDPAQLIETATSSWGMTMESSTDRA